jgi:hypothetical protein
MRVKDLNADRMGSIVKVARRKAAADADADADADVDVDVDDENELDIWWDTTGLECMTESRAAATCRYVPVNVGYRPSPSLSQVGQVLTRVTNRPGQCRVRRGPHPIPNHSSNVLGTVITTNSDSGSETVTVQLDNKPWPLVFPIGKGGRFSLCYADNVWKEPRRGQLVTRGVVGAQVVRTFAELYTGRNRGTIFDSGCDGTKIRIVWHDTEKIETVSCLSAMLRYVCTA